MMKTKKSLTMKESLPNRLILPHQPYHDEYLETITKVFTCASVFGILGPRRWFCRAWSVLVLVCLLAVLGLAIWKVIKALAGWASDIAGHRSVTARMSGTIFYSIATTSFILGSRLSHAWADLSLYWARVEQMTINVSTDGTLKKRVVAVLVFMGAFCFFEHCVSMISLVGLDCPTHLILKTYTLKSHGFILLNNDYSDWAAIPLLIISTVATALWTFPDVIIVLLSMGLSSRYIRLNECVQKICAIEKKQMKWDKEMESLKIYTWRKIREAYVKQAALIRQIDGEIGGIILLSCSCNFFFICLQMFMGITLGKSITVTRRFYYVVSFLWLCIRVTSVVLAASGVNVHSRVALKYIYECEPHCYNVEMDRLQNQLSKDYVALSGLGFFYLNRTILLQMAGAILTYELVLIQFDDGGDDSDATTILGNHTLTNFTGV